MPNGSTIVTFCAAEAADAEALVALRIRALRESLERLGRFDPVRSRERFFVGVLGAVHAAYSG